MLIRTWGRDGSENGRFKHPVSLAIASDDTIYITETDNHRIQKFNVKGEFLKVWENRGSKIDLFDYPKGLAIASNGNVYVADMRNNRIQQFNAKGEYIDKWGECRI